MNGLEKNISTISNNHYHYLMNLENVNGLGLSYKYINGTNTFEPCISIFVENKVDNKFLTSNNIIPKTYMGIKTDVVSIGKISLNSTGVIFFKMRPLKGGAVIGTVTKKSSGTICCIVKKVLKKKLFNKTEYYILSNNHVLAKNNLYPPGTLFIQPSLLEQGNVKTDVVAALDTFIPVKFIKDDPEASNLVDAAIAKINNKNLISNEIYSQGKIQGVSEAALLTPVKKVGFRTGLTHGYVRSINATVTVQITEDSIATFKNQIMSELDTLPGDSGSAILTEDNKIVGMHMAGAQDGFSISNNINFVFKKLNVELYTGK